MIVETLASMFPDFGPKRYGNASLENPAYSLDDPALYEVLAAGSKAASGVTVTHEKSLTIAAVHQAVELISGDVSKLPCYPYKRLPDDDREIFSKHQWYFAVAIRANQFKSAKQFWRDLMVHALLWGNGYAYIARSTRELYNLLPDRTCAEWHNGRLVYVSEVAGEVRALDHSQVLHVRGISTDGIKGCDLVRLARDAWGLSIAAQNFESKFFKNGARMGGTLELPAAMSKTAKDNVEEGFRKVYEDGDNPFKVVVTREGAKFHAGQVNPQQGQVSELRGERRRDVASFYNIPPSKLGIPGSVSYNSYEQESLAYLHGCLHHWLDAIADQCDMKLLTEDELRTDKAYFEHNVSKFTQADWATQVTKLCELRNAEVVSPNEIRKKLNLPKRTDPDGDKYINPNTKSAMAQVDPKEDGLEDEKPKNAHKALFVNTFARMARRIAFDAKQSAKSPAKFEGWLAGKATEHRNVFDEAVLPVAEAYAEVFGGNAAELCAAAGGAMFDSLLTDLAALYAADEPIDNYLNQFERTAPERIAALILENPNG